MLGISGSRLRVVREMETLERNVRWLEYEGRDKHRQALTEELVARRNKDGQSTAQQSIWRRSDKKKTRRS